jgi:2-polyprenyl-3-methyl-5-hydroxy-6-metoxy-1,4-benzoquinol methylase
MTQNQPSRDAAHFERLYAKAEDPWEFRTSRYERAKYAATIRALPPRRFRAALEIGCSIGELTARLAKRCAAVHGIDIAAAPLEIARARFDTVPELRFSQMRVPAEWPVGHYDLIVLSEILYFLSPDDVQGTADRVRASLAATGVVLLVNWLGKTDDPLTGDEAAERFIAALTLPLAVDLQQRYRSFRIDRLRDAA